MGNNEFTTEQLKELKLLYVELIDNAVTFFQEYPELHLAHTRAAARLEETKRQLETIREYKQEHGVYPKIKNQDNTEEYLVELNAIQHKTEQLVSELAPKIDAGSKFRHALLQEVSNKIATHLFKEKDAAKFLTTMMLRAPLPSDHIRNLNNEKNKPIYIAALTVCFLKRLLRRSMVEHEFITSRIPEMVPSEENPEQMVAEPKMLAKFNSDVVIPLVKAALIHNLGSYSVDADKIYAGNRYRLLEEEDRKRLVRTIHDDTLCYLNEGLGLAKIDIAKGEVENAETLKLEKDKFELMKTLITSYTNPRKPLGNILRIPVIYSSFMLSSKPKHKFELIYKAFDILKGGIDKEVMHKDYGEEFLRLVGRYPVGSGINFISKETHLPERAVVIGLNPPKVSTAIVKQVTKRQVQFDDHTQVAVSREYNIAYEEARNTSDFGDEYFEKQFPEGFYWNPAESWERDIDHVKFWRRDNKLKEN